MLNLENNCRDIGKVAFYVKVKIATFAMCTPGLQIHNVATIIGSICTDIFFLKIGEFTNSIFP